MASIDYNGRIVIRSTGAPKHVVAKRSLEEVLLVLENIHESFSGFNPHNERDRKKIEKIMDKTRKVKDKYVSILDMCSQAITQISQDTEFSKSYVPLLAFLERTSDAHSILPFMDLLPMLDVNPRDVVGDAYFEKFTHPKFMDLVSLRMEEAVHLCRSYMSLLSGTMDLQRKPINLMGLASHALYLSQQKTLYKYLEERSIPKGDDNCGDDLIKHLKRIFSDHLELGRYIRKINSALRSSNERIYSSTNTTVYSFEPLIFFYLTNVIGNHFKASYEHEILRAGRPKKELPYVDIRIEAWDENRTGTTFEFFDEEKVIESLDGIDLFAEDGMERTLDHLVENPPEIYSRFKDSMYERVCITTRDNGLGIPEETLATLFEPDRVVDERYRRGNGRTLQVFPLICDLLGADLYIDSQQGKYTEFKLVLPRRPMAEGVIEID